MLHSAVAAPGSRQGIWPEIDTTARDAAIFMGRAENTFAIVRRHYRGGEFNGSTGDFYALFTCADAAVAAEALLLRAGLLTGTRIAQRGKYAVVYGTARDAAEPSERSVA